MNKRLLLILFLNLALLAINRSFAVPPPCSLEQLLETSDYAIEGYVTEIVCEKPHDSDECKPTTESKEFKPEMVSECVATVEVTKSLKGNHNSGDKVEIPFLKLVEECKNGSPLIPGSPKDNLELNSKIRFYNSAYCKYWNIQELEPPPANRN